MIYINELGVTQHIYLIFLYLNRRFNPVRNYRINSVRNRRFTVLKKYEPESNCKRIVSVRFEADFGFDRTGFGLVQVQNRIVATPTFKWPCLLCLILLLNSAGLSFL